MKSKKLISLLLAVAAIFSALSCVSVFAAATDDEAYDMDKVYFLNRIPEEKYICQATADDDYADNEVLVVFFNEYSLNFKEYTPDDFANLGVVAVDQSDINKEIGEDIKASIPAFCDEVVFELGLSPEYKEILQNAIMENSLDKLYFADSIDRLLHIRPELGEMLEDIYEYNQWMVLELDSHDKQNVLDVIKELEKRDDVFIAEPNYYMHIDDPIIVPQPDETQPTTAQEPTNSTVLTPSATEKDSTPDAPQKSTATPDTAVKTSGTVATGQQNFALIISVMLTLSLFGVFTAYRLKKDKK